MKSKACLLLFVCLSGFIGYNAMVSADDRPVAEQADAAKPQSKVAKRGGATGYDTIITHIIKIPAATAAGSYKISDDDLRGKLILHSAFGNDSSSAFCDWPGCDDLKATQPICHNVAASLSADDVLQWDLTATGGLSLKIEKDDGKLYWTWKQDNTNDQYGFCEVKVRSGTVDTTAS